MTTEEPKRIYNGSSETEEYEESHPSYGMIGLARTSIGGQGLSLYGSAVKHGTAIKLSIASSVKRHSLSRDWYSAEKQIVEVYLSGNQLADLLTCMNVGDGIPCTITRNEGKSVPECPEEQARKALQYRTDGHMKKLAGRVAAMETELEKMLDGSEVPKKKQEALRHQVLKIKQDVGVNMDYMKKTLNEYTDDMLTEAKGEFAAMVDSIVHSRGLEGLGAETLISMSKESQPRRRRVISND